MAKRNGTPNYALREARARGDKFYIPDFECNNGHMTKRLTSSGACYECHSASRRANTKKTRNGPKGDEFRAKKNAERTRWLAKPENAGKRELYAQRDLEKFGRRIKRPIAARVDQANHKAKRLGIEGRITVEEISNLLTKQNYICKSCEEQLEDDWTIDHRMPFALKGPNVIENIDILCFSCNRRKWDMHPDEWEQLKQFERDALAIIKNSSINGEISLNRGYI